MRKNIPWFLLLIPAGVLGYLYYPTFQWMADRWFAGDSYFAHGPLIPMVSAYWLWQKRDELKSGWEGSNAGLFLLAAAALIQIVSFLLRVYFLSMFSFVLILLGAILYLFGRKIFKITLFPVLFLMLMIPLPLLAISEITLHLKNFVTEVSAFLLNQIGIPAVREGSYIHTKNAVMLVGDPCSGLRSFLAFLCLGIVFAYGSGLSWPKRVFLVFIGFPVAIASNVLRVFSLGVLSELYGMDLVHKYIHDPSGYVVFAIALVFFIYIRKKLELTAVKAGAA